MDAAKETKLEAKLVKGVKALGGVCLKFTSPGTAGVTDRLVLLPGGVHAFIEIKRLGEAPSRLQTHFLRQMRGLGHYADWVSTEERLSLVLQELEFAIRLQAQGNG